jgi:hypothetical protein
MAVLKLNGLARGARGFGDAGGEFSDCVGKDNYPCLHVRKWILGQAHTGDTSQKRAPKHGPSSVPRLEASKKREAVLSTPPGPKGNL